MQLSSPFVLYRLPYQNNIYLIQDTVKSHMQQLPTPLHLDKAFVFAPYDSTTEAIYTFENKNTCRLSEEDFKQLDFSIQLIEREIITTKKNTYNQQIKNIINNIKNKSIDKAVLSRIITIKKKANTDFSRLFLQLHYKYPSAFVYMAYLPNGSLWCGASPELLGSFQQNNFETMALAGTQHIVNNTIENIKWQQKEIEEQAWVQRYIEDLLNRYELNFSKAKTHTKVAGHLAHICTPYTTNTTYAQALKLIKDLHPTPAVCGTPQNTSQTLLTKLEQHHRQYYSGYLGPINQKDFELYVNLRCMEISKHNFHIHVGGGITIDSIAEKEWEETQNKAKTILEALL